MPLRPPSIPLPPLFRLHRSLTLLSFFFFFNDTATTEIYTLSLHDALPIFVLDGWDHSPALRRARWGAAQDPRRREDARSEEHTSELQSQFHLVCRLLLEKKKKKKKDTSDHESKERRDTEIRICDQESMWSR